MEAREKVQTFRVPARFIQAVLRHDRRVDGPIYVRNRMSEFVIENEQSPLIEYENTFTGPEMELLFTAFHKADPSGIATFRSIAEWIYAASGRRGQLTKAYYAAVASLQRNHQILDKQDSRYYFSSIPPVATEATRDQFTGAAIFRVKVASELKVESSWFYFVPSGLSGILRNAGLRRVETPHIKLFCYTLTRIKSQQPQMSLEFEKICQASGIKNHLRFGHADGARKLIMSGLNAMKVADFLRTWNWDGRERIQVEPGRIGLG